MREKTVAGKNKRLLHETLWQEMEDSLITKIGF